MHESTGHHHACKKGTLAVGRPTWGYTGEGDSMERDAYSGSNLENCPLLSTFLRSIALLYCKRHDGSNPLHPNII